MSAQPKQYLSLTEYFKLEETSEINHEYYQGQVFDRAGAKENHNLIVMAVGSSLNNQLEDTPCPPTRGCPPFS